MNHSRLWFFQLNFHLEKKSTSVDRRLRRLSSSSSPLLWAWRSGSSERLVDRFFHVVDLEHLAFFVDRLELPSVDAKYLVFYLQLSETKLILCGQMFLWTCLISLSPPPSPFTLHPRSLLPLSPTLSEITPFPLCFKSSVHDQIFAGRSMLLVQVSSFG